MQRFTLISIFLLAFAIKSQAQEIKDFTYKIYGLARTDYFFNSRQNEETVEGIFLMFPKDHAYDPLGHDMNAHAESSRYNLHTRLGVDLTGPEIWGAKTSAKIEFDFRGSGSTFGVIRLRHAYAKLDWGNNEWLLGQTWHPLYGTVAPELMNLNMGAPFQPFNRAPQIQYSYAPKNLLFRASILWQTQYLSVGPKGKSRDYIHNSNIPEMFVGLDYQDATWTAGAGLHFSSLVPRLSSSVINPNNGMQESYKVSERINGLSGEVHFKYKDKKLMVAGKSVLSSNLTQCSTLGGYGSTSINNETDEREYAPLRISHSWLNVMYGTKWRGGVFLGYLKNLGASKEVFNLCGTGTDVDQLTNASVELTYNIPHWKIGAEYSLTTAWYGTNDDKGKVHDTHDVSNNRFVISALYSF